MEASPSHQGSEGFWFFILFYFLVPKISSVSVNLVIIE